MSTLEEFLARAIVPCDFLVALDVSSPDAAQTLAQTLAALVQLNEDFEESTMPGGKPGWFAMSSLMAMSMTYCRTPTELAKTRLVEAIENAREHA